MLRSSLAIERELRSEEEEEEDSREGMVEREEAVEEGGWVTSTHGGLLSSSGRGVWVLDVCGCCDELLLFCADGCK